MTQGIEKLREEIKFLLGINRVQRMLNRLSNTLLGFDRNVTMVFFKGLNGDVFDRTSEGRTEDHRLAGRRTFLNDPLHGR